MLCLPLLLEIDDDFVQCSTFLEFVSCAEPPVVVCEELLVGVDFTMGTVWFPMGLEERRRKRSFSVTENGTIGPIK